MSWKLDFENTLKSTERSLHLPEKLFVGAGPTNCSERVLRALSLQTSTLNREIYEILDNIQSSLKYLFQTKNIVTLVQQTSGNGGLETIITNLVKPEESIIVAVGGFWGERTIQIAERYEIKITRITVPLGEVFSLDVLEKEIIKVNPIALFITQGDSSVGTNQPLDGLGEICHRHHCLLVVDAISSFGGVPLFVDRWKIDAAVGGSQKAVSAPPGMCFLTFSESAVFHYTYSSNMLCAVKEALAVIAEEGLERTWLKHKNCAERLWQGLETLGLKILVTKEENRLWTVISAKLPEEIDMHRLLQYLDEKYQTQISIGMGPTEKEGIIRIGIMGCNARKEIVDYVLRVLEDGMKYLRENKQILMK